MALAFGSLIDWCSATSTSFKTMGDSEFALIAVSAMPTLLGCETLNVTYASCFRWSSLFLARSSMSAEDWSRFVFQSRRVRCLFRARDHHFRGFDDDIHRVALFQFQFVGAFSRDDGLDQTLADANRNVCHDVAE